MVDNGMRQISASKPGSARSDIQINIFKIGKKILIKQADPGKYLDIIQSCASACARTSSRARSRAGRVMAGCDAGCGWFVAGFGNAAQVSEKPLV